MFFLRLSLRLFPRLSLNVARHMLLLIKLAILLFFHLLIFGVLNLAGDKNKIKNLLFSVALCCVGFCGCDINDGDNKFYGCLDTL